MGLLSMRSRLKATALNWFVPSMSFTRKRCSWVLPSFLTFVPASRGKDLAVLVEQHLVDAAAHVLGDDLHLLLVAVELLARQGRHDGHLRRRLDPGASRSGAAFSPSAATTAVSASTLLIDPGHDLGAVEPLEEPRDGIEAGLPVEPVVDVPADELVAPLAGVVVARGRPEDPALAVAVGVEGQQAPCRPSSGTSGWCRRSPPRRPAGRRRRC